MSELERREMGESIALKLTSPDLNFIPSWRKTSRKLLTLMHDFDERQMKALYTVVGLFWYTKKSRLTTLSYLTAPQEQADKMWSTVYSLSAYSGWILEEDENHYNALSEKRYDALVNMLNVLSEQYGITADKDGRVPSLIAHITAWSDYRDNYRTSAKDQLAYNHNSEVFLFVERHHERVDEIIRYGRACGYVGMNDADFESYLKHHSAVQDGWL